MGAAGAENPPSSFYPGERIEQKVIRQFGRLLSPALTDVRMSWGGLDATQAPSTAPPVFAGGRLLFYAFVKQVAGNITPMTVQLSAMSRSGPFAFNIELDPAHAVSGRTVATLAARARIRPVCPAVEDSLARPSGAAMDRLLPPFGHPVRFACTRS